MENEEELKTVTSAVNSRKHLSPKRRFRAIVRLVIANAPWMQTSEVRFGTNVYKKRNVMNLELEHKALLNIPPEDRTEKENEIIYNTIGGFKFYRKYPEHVKRLLAGYSQFVYYGADRTIVRCNNYATAIFFVLNGEVNVIDEKYDSFLDETERTVRETLSPGDVFGELCLLHNLRRMETIVSITPIEFLILNREHFDVVLRNTVKEEWDRISRVMEMFDYFEHWDTVRIGECCMQSFLNHYKKGEIIIGDGTGRSNYVHFVVEGKCLLIEHLLVQVLKPTVETYDYGVYRPSAKSYSTEPAAFQVFGENFVGYIKPSRTSQDMMQIHQFANSMFLDDDRQSTVRRSLFRKASLTSEYSAEEEGEDDVKTPKNVKTVYMQVCVFNKKACFSLGESMSNRRVVADEDCVCMLIPSFLLLGRDCVWLRIKQYICKQIPDTNEVFMEFVKQRRWRKFKHDLVRPLLSKSCNNWHANIPYSIRVRSDFDYKPKLTDPSTRQGIHSHD